MKSILINSELCNGCKNCQLACMAEHSIENSIWFLNLEDRANQARNFIEADANGKPVPVFCRHCHQPACVTACMSGAMTKDPKSGVVVNNPTKCAGCWMCVMSCPYGIVRPDLKEGKVAVKCDFCNGRPVPRCVEACPTGAISLVEVDAFSQTAPEKEAAL